VPANTTWWTQFPKTGAKGPQSFESVDPSDKGKYLGQCFQVTCARAGADWYNKINRRYFCEVCATAINEACLAYGQAEICKPAR
jgi:hypothetical protein